MTADEGARTVTPGRAAQELELGRDEFRLALQLGLVRTVPVGEGGRRRVERGELDRLRAAPDFPAGLRDRVRAVGTGEAAALLEITPERFTRLARTGHISPVGFSLNRYRAVVWTYLAEDVAEFGLTCPALLTGRLPGELRERLAAHEDRRPRNWRVRRLGVLLRASADPWARAAAIASLLDPLQVAEVVDDPFERAHLDRLRPPPPPGMPVRATAHDIAERLTRADDPDEILWHRLSLALAVDEARAERPAPYPGGGGALASPRPPVLTMAPVPSVSPVRRQRTGRPGAPVPLGAAVPASWGGGGPEASPPPEVALLPPVPPVPPAPPVPAVLPASPVPSAVPLPEERSEGIGRPPARPGRTRLLDRFRRRAATEGGRAKGRRRPVSWP
ncbi:DUF6397 family protein [Streptomyces sp. NPDC002057]|uniref:DUF6397 family protein n=1 Tax=Streptomyces sp. NPDC002057 TaxID=3154664 RepID=UPI0033301EC4